MYKHIIRLCEIDKRVRPFNRANCVLSLCLRLPAPVCKLYTRSMGWIYYGENGTHYGAQLYYNIEDLHTENIIYCEL